MNQVLKDNGWVLYHTCKTCKGLVQHYNHKDHAGFEITIRVARNTARILKNNSIIAGPFWAYSMQQQLDEFIPKLTK